MIGPEITLILKVPPCSFVRGPCLSFSCSWIWLGNAASFFPAASTAGMIYFSEYSVLRLLPVVTMKSGLAFRNWVSRGRAISQVEKISLEGSFLLPLSRSVSFDFSSALVILANFRAEELVRVAKPPVKLPPLTRIPSSARRSNSSAGQSAGTRDCGRDSYGHGNIALANDNS